MRVGMVRGMPPAPLEFSPSQPKSTRLPAAADDLARRLAHLASLKLIRTDNGTTAGGSSWSSAIGEREQPFYSRWYIRCQIGNMATIDDPATVLGLALAWTPSVVLLAITGSLSPTAIDFVLDVNQSEATRFVALDGEDLRWIGSDPVRFSSILERRSWPDGKRTPWIS